MPNAKRILDAKAVYARLTSVRRARQENIVVFCLDSRGYAIRRELVSVGILNASLIHPREVFYPAIVNNAAGIVVAHNHPSGDTEPSADDLEITARLITAGKILGITMADHIIVGNSGYTSLRERGLLS